jgi:hypothetical protein
MLYINNSLKNAKMRVVARSNLGTDFIDEMNPTEE